MRTMLAELILSRCALFRLSPILLNRPRSLGIVQYAMVLLLAVLFVMSVGSLSIEAWLYQYYSLPS